MLRADLARTVRLPGREDSVGVFNRRDYSAVGGERFADFAESLFRAATNEVNGRRIQ